MSSKAPKALLTAIDQMEQLPGIAGVFSEVRLQIFHREPMRRDDWAYITSSGWLYVNPQRQATAAEWVYMLSHCCLHLALGHIRKEKQGDILWERACDCVVSRFLLASKIGKPPAQFAELPPANAKEETAFYQWLWEHPDEKIPNYFTMSSGQSGMRFDYVPTGQDWRQLFSEDLQWSIRKALRGAADAQAEPACTCRPAELAKAWFISSYPLLGAIAARFRLVTDGTALTRMGIRIAAVSCHMAEIYINPHAGLSTEEWRFVLAHEFLHAALRHDLRLEGRDPLLWNIACDFVINDWLLEMHVGCMPDGALYDAQFHGLSAEAVYDQILFEARRYEKLRSGDLLYGEDIQKSAGELDDFYRRALQRGLQYHESSNRGFLPAGLIEEIHALSTPPIPWDVQLGTWFVRQFPATQPHRSYARMSRRQSSSPDIPRPAWIYPSEAQTEKTFGIVLDTSGSMSRALLAAALGTIASYSAARGVHAVRLVFCDAAVYDQGVVPPERLSEAVYVQGRGGTQLQPGVDFFVHAEDFPKDAPILVITDGQCEHLHFHGRTHAYLLPRGHRLPFTAKGKIFRLD